MKPSEDEPTKHQPKFADSSIEAPPSKVAAFLRLDPSEIYRTLKSDGVADEDIPEQIRKIGQSNHLKETRNREYLSAPKSLSQESIKRSSDFGRIFSMMLSTVEYLATQAGQRGIWKNSETARARASLSQHILPLIENFVQKRNDAKIDQIEDAINSIRELQYMVDFQKRNSWEFSDIFEQFANQFFWNKENGIYEYEQSNLSDTLDWIRRILLITGGRFFKKIVGRSNFSLSPVPTTYFVIFVANGAKKFFSAPFASHFIEMSEEKEDFVITISVDFRDYYRFLFSENEKIENEARIRKNIKSF